MRLWRHTRVWALAVGLGFGGALGGAWAGALHSGAPTPAFQPQALLDDYCSGCHNDIDRAAKLSFDDLRPADLPKGAHADVWEAILRKVVQDEMPPHTKRQPSPAQRAAFVRWLGGGRAAYAMAHPDPGRATLRRLNRVEYANAVRDLLALNVDVARDLPQDNSGYGFDNIAQVLSVSPTLVERYVAVACPQGERTGAAQGWLAHELWPARL